MSAEKRCCGRVDCRGEDGEPREAKWGVTLLLVPHRGYLGPPWKVQTNIAVCDAHRDPMADSFITEDAWNLVLDYVASLKRSKPHRTSTRAEFFPLDGSTAVQ